MFINLLQHISDALFMCSLITFNALIKNLISNGRMSYSMKFPIRTILQFQHFVYEIYHLIAFRH
jgi:hypothetical protein